MNNSAETSLARVDCRQSGFINKPISRQSTGAGARVKESELELRIGDWSPLIKNPEAYYKAMCEKRWGGNFDLVRAVVDDAVAAFSRHKDEKGKEIDRRIWLKIANRVDYTEFLDAVVQKASEIRQYLMSGKHYYNPAATFQTVLNERFPRPTGTSKRKGGAK